MGEEVLRLGRAPLIVGGKTALSITKSEIAKSVAETCSQYEFIEHTGSCNEERAKELAQLAELKGYDVIVGVGGGVICDFAKLCGYFARLPVICIPTSSATCAAYTPLSVRYTPEGRTVGSLHYSYEVNAVVVDTAILAAQPIRLLLAGVFDALAKFIEIKQRFTANSPLGLDYAFSMAETSYNTLNGLTDRCIEDMKKGEIIVKLEEDVKTFSSILTQTIIDIISYSFPLFNTLSSFCSIFLFS